MWRIPKLCHRLSSCGNVMKSVSFNSILALLSTFLPLWKLGSEYVRVGLYHSLLDPVGTGLDRASTDNVSTWFSCQKVHVSYSAVKVPTHGVMRPIYWTAEALLLHSVLCIQLYAFSAYVQPGGGATTFSMGWYRARSLLNKWPV